MRTFILILPVGGPKWIIDVIRIVVAMLITLVRLLRRIQIGRQLGRKRKPGRFIIAIRGGLLAEAIISRRAVPVRMSLSNQPGEFCNGIVSSVGSEIVSHRICSDTVFRTSSPDAYALKNTRRANLDYRSWWIMNLKRGVVSQC